MLWDIIRDFIVQHITGGWTSAGESFGCIVNGESGDTVNDIIFYIQTGDSIDGDGGIIHNSFALGLGDWLATTLTIIAMCLLFAFAVWLIRWVFKAVSSAFLLRR